MIRGIKSETKVYFSISQRGKPEPTLSRRGKATARALSASQGGVTSATCLPFAAFWTQYNPLPRASQRVGGGGRRVDTKEGGRGKEFENHTHGAGVPSFSLGRRANLGGQ